MATPREAEVYVDGYLVGTVDDFDGWSQRLRIEPGEHEVELFLEGFRSVRQKMLFRPGETYKIRATLEKADGSETPAVRPSPSPGDSTPTSAPSERERGRARMQRGQAQGFDTLAIQVQPADAVILVGDGELADLVGGAHVAARTRPRPANSRTRLPATDAPT